MYACQQHYPSLAVANVVMIGSDGHPHGLSDRLAKELGVTVKELGWEDLCRGREKCDGMQSLNALPAMAGIL
jgi:hypothetical protein